MKQLDQIDRDQIHMMSFDMMVSEHSIVRVIDVFLDFALSSDLGFKAKEQLTGRPSYPVRTLLGIYLYGYLHKTRTSRDLEQACQTNVELWWLLRGQKPCYKTISDFRKDNRRAFRNLFKLEYKRRQAIVEHPFRSIKRAWGYTYTLLKTKPKVETEFSLIFLCYNLRRTMSILGRNGLIEALKRAFGFIWTLTSPETGHIIRKPGKRPVGKSGAK